jgi:hypothetical protein
VLLSQLDSGEQGIHAGDFVFGSRLRIALIVDGTSVHPSANTGYGTHAVNLRAQTTTVNLLPNDLRVSRQRIVKIARAVGERIMNTTGLSDNAYHGAAMLLDEDNGYIGVNGLFDNPTDPALKLIFDEAMSEVHSDQDVCTDEIARVAYLVIFSEDLPE